MFQDEEFYTLIPHDGSPTLHFSITKLRKLLMAEPELFVAVTGPLTPSYIDYLMREGGVEEFNVERITPEIAKFPGFALLFGPDADQPQIIDGAHRAVWRYRNGFKDFTCAALPLEVAKARCLMDFPPGYAEVAERATKEKLPTREILARMRGQLPGVTGK